MLKRLSLDAKLKVKLGSRFTVYFQPPSNIELKYPACIYSFAGTNDARADNIKYVLFERYDVKLVVASPDDQAVADFLKDSSMTYIASYQAGATQYNFMFRTII